MSHFPLQHRLLWLAILAPCLLASCTYYSAARLTAVRTGDTVSVALDPNSAARWDPTHDSLLVECAGCAQGSGRIVERFDTRNSAAYGIEPTQTVTLHLYSMGHEDTVITLAGAGTADNNAAAPTLRRFTPPRRNRSEASEEEVVSTRTKEKTVKRATQLKVTAAEGVAIYKDKTKKEVIKILPQGTVMTLLSREGDLYSVSVDGGEGFVEAEAVKILE
jgi:hypothetical protein